MSHLQKQIDEAFRERTTPELCLGYVRYEFVRKLKPTRYMAFWMEALNDSKAFDDLIDRAIEAEGKMNDL